jgi:hypothetical protein
MKPANLISVVAIAAMLTMMLSSCKPSQSAINGQVFIATEGGVSFRLGAVEVLLIRKSDATNYLQKTISEINDKLKSETGAALEAYQEDVTNAQTDLDAANKSIADEIPIETQAQNEYDAAKAKYDAIMASAPYLTNAVYLKIKHDLIERTYQVQRDQQSITTDEKGISQTSQPGVSVWNPPVYKIAGYWSQPDESGRVALNQSYKIYLAMAQRDIENNEQQMQSDNETLENIIATFGSFQSSKLKLAHSALQEANLRLNEDQSTVYSDEKKLQQILGQTPNYPHPTSRADLLSDFTVPTISKVNTDADGNFSILCPCRGRFTIFVSAQRQTGLTKERYYWLVDAPNKNDGKRILLNNNNLVEIDPDGYFNP